MSAAVKKKVSSPIKPTLTGEMISQEDREFVNFLFDKLLSHTDTAMNDLQEDDTCCDHLQFAQLELFQ